MSTAKQRHRRRRRAERASAKAWAAKGGTDGFLRLMYADCSALYALANYVHPWFQALTRRPTGATL